MNLDAVRRARFFPVRHHSPRATRALEQFLDETRPQAVLVEGPADATPLLDILNDAETRPPVAILGYRTDGPPQSTLWPFATYSPEYAAIRWGSVHGCAVRFIDLPVGQWLALGDDEHEEPAADDSNPFADLAFAGGYRSFEEFWEAQYEAPDHSHPGFARIMDSFSGWSRALHARPLDRMRDAFMARSIWELIESQSIEPERVAVVMGGAHVSAFLAGDVDPETLGGLKEPLASEITVIPFSFTRLAEQTGYGAGNRAPLFYQRAYDASCDYRRAALEALLEIAQNLRLRGFAVSLADTIEAYRLALRLAELRQKAQPGLDEVREGAIATVFRGETGLVNQMLWPATVGTRVGRVAARAGRNALQQEFWNEVRARRLPSHDSLESFTLQLHNDVEIGTSVFLHRLRVAGIPYATFRGSKSGGVEALRRVREAWEAQWTPATDVALAESIALGDSLRQVATRRLDEQLSAAATTGTAADLLLEAVVADCPRTAVAALDACDRFATSDDDLPSLGKACQALSGLVSFGTSRSMAEGGDEAVKRLCLKTFDRSVLRAPAASVVDDSGVAAVKGAIHALHEVATAQPLVDAAAWFAAARGIIDSYAVHPTLAGQCAGLLYLAQKTEDAEVALIVEQRVSDVRHPDRAAAFLDGFLGVNALVLVRNRHIVKVLDAFLAALPSDGFRDDLAVLRRAFSSLGATERRYLLENVLALREIRGASGEVKEIIHASDESLSAIDAEVSKALDDLDDLL